MLKATKFFTFVDDAGQKHKMPEQQPVQQFSDVTIVCDGPKCAARNNSSTPTTYAWQEEVAVEDPLALIPDGVFHMISAEFVRGAGAKTFCGKQCLLDYLRDVYVPPLSPKEEESQRLQNERVFERNSKEKIEEVLAEFPDAVEEAEHCFRNPSTDNTTGHAADPDGTIN